MASTSAAAGTGASESHTPTQAGFFSSIKNLINPSSSAGYERVPQGENPDYGATNGGNTTTSVAPKALPKRSAEGSKVEPKVYLANERTYLNWLRTSLLIASFALALFNGSSPYRHDPNSPHIPEGKHTQWSLGRIFGIVYACISIVVLVYGYWGFRRRSRLIRERYSGHFDELVGPPLICLALFVAVLLNFIFRVQQREQSKTNPSPKNPWLDLLEILPFSINLPSSFSASNSTGVSNTLLGMFMPSSN